MVVIYFIGVSVIFGLINYHKVKDSVLKYFVFFLIYVFFFAEGLGAFVGLYLEKNAFPIFNIYIIINFIFHFLLFRALFTKYHKRKMMNYIIAIYLVCVIYNLIFNLNSFIKDMQLFLLFFGAFLLIITIIVYLIDIINDDTIVFKITKFLPFWISIGNLLFFIGIIPIFIMRHHLDFSGLYDIILRSLNFVMYGCFTLGFIWTEKKYNLL